MSCQSGFQRSQVGCVFPWIEVMVGDLMDYTLDWKGAPPGPWLPDGDTIVSVVWTVPSGVTETASSFTDTTTTIWLSTPTVGVYVIAGTITTSAGQVKTQAFQIRVQAP